MQTGHFSPLYGFAQLLAGMASEGKVPFTASLISPGDLQDCLWTLAESLEKEERSILHSWLRRKFEGGFENLYSSFMLPSDLM